MLLAGAFLVLRTVRRPQGGRNLVDLLLGDGGAADAKANATEADKANHLLNLPKLTPRPSPVRTGRTVPRLTRRPQAGY